MTRKSRILQWNIVVILIINLKIKHILIAIFYLMRNDLGAFGFCRAWPAQSVSDLKTSTKTYLWMSYTMNCRCSLLFSYSHFTIEFRIHFFSSHKKLFLILLCKYCMTLSTCFLEIKLGSFFLCSYGHDGCVSVNRRNKLVALSSVNNQKRQDAVLFCHLVLCVLIGSCEFPDTLQLFGWPDTWLIMMMNTFCI